MHLLAREECNKYDLTSPPCFFDWPNIMIGAGGLLLFPCSTHIFAVSVSVLMSEVAKHK